MKHPRIEIYKYRKQPDEAAAARIHENILKGTSSEKEVVSAWYTFLEEQLVFPFYAYIESPRSSPNVISSSRVKVVKLAAMERCSAHGIWLVGYPTPIRAENVFYYCLADLRSVETEIHAYQVIQDYFYWINQ